HIRTHDVTAAAFDLAGDPSFVAGGAPWAPLKLYYDITFHLERMQRLHDAVIAEGGESPFGEWLEAWGDRPPKSDRVTTRVLCADYFPVREAALKAHATQVDPDGRWFAIPRQMQEQVWPTEDFELAATRLAVQLPEDDLFAGVAPDDQAAPGTPATWLAPRRTEEL
ncbi:MAG: mycothiol conjugate amidase Mca, partial [Actinomycetota bacterium]